MSDRKESYCPDCGKLKYNKSARCISCAGKHKIKHPEWTRVEYARYWQLNKKYGMKPEDFDGYWMACKGKCFICDKNMSMPTSGRGQSLDSVAVDHDHKNGKVRGLLCGACNKALGYFEDSYEIINKALKYLSYGK